jgi:hypothetical protein
MLVWFLFTLPRAYQVAAYTSLSSASSKPFATMSAVARTSLLLGRSRFQVLSLPGPDGWLFNIAHKAGNDHLREVLPSIGKKPA